MNLFWHSSESGDHSLMDRLNSATIIEDLVALTRSDLPRQVDVLVDAYLMNSNPGQHWQKRAELAQGFLNAAPLSELSYRIWRRIAGEDDDETASQPASMEFLPPIEFQIDR